MGEPAEILRLLDFPDVEDKPKQKLFWFFSPCCNIEHGKTALYGTSNTSLQCKKCGENFYLHVDNGYICVISQKFYDTPELYEHEFFCALKSTKILCPVCKHDENILTDLADHELSFVCKKCESHYTVRVSNGWFCTKPTYIKEKVNRRNDSR